MRWCERPTTQESNRSRYPLRSAQGVCILLITEMTLVGTGVLVEDGTGSPSELARSQNWVACCGVCAATFTLFMNACMGEGGRGPSSEAPGVRVVRRSSGRLFRWTRTPPLPSEKNSLDRATLLLILRARLSRAPTATATHSRKTHLNQFLFSAFMPPIIRRDTRS